MSIADRPKPEQDANGRFLSGNIGGGRPKGSRNRLGEDFLKALSADFEQHGEAVIQKVRETKPEVYLRVVADLLPKNVLVDRPERDVREMTDEELTAVLLSGPPGRAVAWRSIAS